MAKFRANPIPEWATRITRLRKKLSISQGELARRVECSAMTVSRWERGLLAPSAEYYLQLGKLAGATGCWFFWGQTGLQVGDVLAMLPRARGNGQLPTSAPLDPARAGSSAKMVAEKDVLVPLPLLRATAGTHGGSGAKLLTLDGAIESMIGAPIGWCPNPNYTSMLRVKGNSMEPLIHDGNIIAVDSLQTDRAELDGKIVVATSEAKGLCVSRLRRYETLDVLESENHEYGSVVLGKNSGWRILGRVLWWISAAP